MLLCLLLCLLLLLLFICLLLLFICVLLLFVYCCCCLLVYCCCCLCVYCSVLTIGPSLPLAPDGPVGPGDPAAPASPGRPAWPVSPRPPLCPSLPEGPGGPGGPGAPWKHLGDEGHLFTAIFWSITVCELKIFSWKSQTWYISVWMNDRLVIDEVLQRWPYTSTRRANSSTRTRHTRSTLRTHAHTRDNRIAFTKKHILYNSLFCIYFVQFKAIKSVVMNDLRRSLRFLQGVQVHHEFL